MTLKINPRAYLDSPVSRIFARVAEQVDHIQGLRRQMLEDGFGDHVSDYDTQIDDMSKKLGAVDYSSDFYDFVMMITEEVIDMLTVDNDFREAYQNFSWNDPATTRAIVHRAQNVMEKYFETSPRFKRNVFLRFDEQDIMERGANLGSHSLRASTCVFDDDGEERIFTSHVISINIHESVIKSNFGPNGILSTLIHENFHALEDMFRCYAENMYFVGGVIDEKTHDCLLGSQIFYPDQETRSYAHSLYWEHVSERFCRTMQVFFETCFEKEFGDEHRHTHPDVLKTIEKIMGKTIHHPS